MNESHGGNEFDISGNIGENSGACVSVGVVSVDSSLVIILFSGKSEGLEVGSIMFAASLGASWTSCNIVAVSALIDRFPVRGIMLPLWRTESRDW